MLNKILRYFILAGLFTIPAIPLIVANASFFPFITGKAFTFRIIVLLISGAWVILALRDRDYLPKKSWISASFLVFLVVIFIADIFGVNPRKAVWSNFERMEGFITFLHLLGYFFVASSILVKEKMWNWFFHAFLGVGFFVYLYGILQLSGELTINQGGVRLDATFGNSAYLAVYLIFMIFLALFFMARKREEALANISISYLIGFILAFLYPFYTYFSSIFQVWRQYGQIPESFNPSFFTGFYGEMGFYVSIVMIIVFSFILYTSEVLGKIKNSKYIFIFLNSLFVFTGILLIFDRMPMRILADKTRNLELAVWITMIISVILAIGIGFLLNVYSRDQKNTLKTILYVIFSLVGTKILFFTATRGAILGLVGGLLLSSILIIFFEKENGFSKKICWGVVIAIFAISAGFMAVRNTSLVKNNPVLVRFAGISFSEAKSQARYFVWPMAMKGFLENPVLGYGQEGFNFVFNKYYNPKMFSQEPWFDRTHNVFLDWLVAGGILGLLGYLSLFFFALYFIYRKWEGPMKARKIWKSLFSGEKSDFSAVEKSVLDGLLFAYFFHNLFVFDHLISYIMFFTLLAYLHSRNGIPVKYFEGKRWISADREIRKLGTTPVVVALSVIFLLYFFNYKGVATSQTLIDALSPNPAGLSKNVEYFKKTVSYNSFASQEVAEQVLMSAMNSRGGNDQAVSQELFSLGKEAMGKEIDRNPEDARLRLFMGSFYNRYALYDNAIKELEEALRLSPQKQSVIFELGTSYVNKGDYKTALSTFEKAYNLAPEFSEARTIYAVGAIYAGNDSLAEKLLQAGGGQVDNRIVQAYFAAKKYGKLLSMFKSAIKASPENPSLHLSLAALYLQMGERTNAIASLQVVKELDPSSAEKIDYYIKEIRAGRNP